MFNPIYEKELKNRRTFAVISHPDAGKTTITEKMLFLGKVIHSIGTRKRKRSKNYTTSDWMDIEKTRGISVTTSVMQFKYKNILINLLDTPGHQDFSEDTYRILTAVDCCLVIIDAAKGIEDRTKKLIDVTKIHNTPIITFINKLDRDSKEPIEIIDEIEKKLKFTCAPITWPIGCGKHFQGVFHIHESLIYLHESKDLKEKYSSKTKKVPYNSSILLNETTEIGLKSHFFQELDLIINIYAKFDHEKFLQGTLTPVFFGSALKNFGIDHILNSIVKWAPSPLHRYTETRKVDPKEKKFTGFVFKIQANMDLKHRDRIAFIRIVSGKYKKGIKLRHVRMQKNIVINDAFSFLAGERLLINTAYPGDVIGVHNHGTIKIGDTFTEGEEIKFTGIPSFAPEIFRRIYLKNPLKQKQLVKGLMQLSEEGAVQVFRPINNNYLILGAIGTLQFDVVLDRLKVEYKIDAICEQVDIILARWVIFKKNAASHNFKKRQSAYLAYDSSNFLTYLSPTNAHLNIVMNKYSDIVFRKIREQ